MNAPVDHRRSTSRVRLLGVVGAGLAAVLVWVVAVPLLGVDLRITTPTGTQTVGILVTFAFAVVAASAGWASLAVLERVTRRAIAIWTATAVAFLLVSLVPPFLNSVTTGAAVVLVLMHLVVAAVLVPTMRRTAA